MSDDSDNYIDLLDALKQLTEAADNFAANQSPYRDPRYGLVPPVTVQECRQLSAALAKSHALLDQADGVRVVPAATKAMLEWAKEAENAWRTEGSPTVVPYAFLRAFLDEWTE